MKYLVTIFIFVSVLFFAACENPKPNANATSQTTSEVENSDEIYLEKGKEIAATTFATLSKNLQEAMKEGGVSNAVKYCNLAASPLVDSLELVHHAQIRRTSLQLRNPKNKPTPPELKQLEAYQKQLESGEDLKPVLNQINLETISFYAPIHIMPLCQKCHGKVGDTLLEEDYKLIQQLYPDDKAIGYASGDWRGMWSISFKK